MLMAMLIICLICCLAGCVPYIYYVSKILKLKEPPVFEFIHSHISIVVNAYHEGYRLKKRLSNLLETNYPKDLISVYVVNDGTDEDFKYEGVEVITFKERKGKSACINYMLSRVVDDIVVFTDADVSNDKETLDNLIAPFSDERIGAVCADVVVSLPNSSASAGAETAYRSVYGSMCLVDGENVVNFNGQMFACRKSVVPQISEIGADDANVAIKCHENGYITNYANGAKVYEGQAVNLRAQFKQKIRRANALINSLSHYKNAPKMRLWMSIVSPTFFVTAFVAFCLFLLPFSLIAGIVLLIVCRCVPNNLFCSFIINQFYLFIGMWFVRDSRTWDVVNKG